MSTKDLDGAIERYRADLRAEAELAAGDLDEVEDHLRALVDELRATGATAEVAFATAVRRLGAARDVARECARVRPAFGARLTALRAWSAAALYIPQIVFLSWFIARAPHDVAPMLVPDLAVGVALCLGMFARRTWARGLLVGVAAAGAAQAAYYYVALGTHVSAPLLLCNVGLLAFVVPWRRGELSRAGWALACLGFGLDGLETALTVARNHIVGSYDVVTPATSIVAFTAAVAGIAGVLVRARWSTPVLAFASAAMVAVIAQLPGHWLYLDGIYLQSVVMLAAAAALSWPSARPGWGNVRAVA